VGYELMSDSLRSREECRLVTWGVQAGHVGGGAGWSRGECRLVTWGGVQAGHVGSAGWSRGECRLVT
jgi:hypothetical protein